MEPPEQDGDQGGQAGEEEEGDESWELAAQALPGRDPVARHPVIVRLY